MTMTLEHCVFKVQREVTNVSGPPIHLLRNDAARLAIQQSHRWRSALGSGGATVVVSGGQSAASLAAQRDGQRAPTVHVRQGEPIRVFTARDLIFASAEGAKG